MKKKLGITLLIFSLLAGCAGGSGASQTTPETTVPETSAVETVVEETLEETEEELWDEEDETAETDLVVEGEDGFLIFEAAVSMKGISAGILKKDYVLKNSSTDYLEWDDVKKLSKEERNLARNEIYARHGYKFKNKELLNYFKKKSWYSPKVDPKKFSESAFNSYEKHNVNYLQSLVTQSGKKNLSKANTKKKVDSYGYEQGHSKLSFRIKKGSLKKKDGYYQVEAVYCQPVTVSGKLKIGDTVKVSFNDLTGEKMTLVRESDGLYTKDGSRQFEYPEERGKSVVLYEDSADRVDKPVYEGKLYIRKDAVEGRNFGEEVKFKSSRVKKKNLTYNAVYFDSKGYVVRLMNFGD